MVCHGTSHGMSWRKTCYVTAIQSGSHHGVSWLHLSLRCRRQQRHPPARAGLVPHGPAHPPQFTAPIASHHTGVPPRPAPPYRHTVTAVWPLAGPPWLVQSGPDLCRRETAWAGSGAATGAGLSRHRCVPAPGVRRHPVLGLGCRHGAIRPRQALVVPIARQHRHHSAHLELHQFGHLPRRLALVERAGIEAGREAFRRNAMVYTDLLPESGGQHVGS